MASFRSAIRARMLVEDMDRSPVESEDTLPAFCCFQLRKCAPTTAPSFQHFREYKS